MRVGAISAASNVDIHNSVFTRIQVVWNAKRRRELDGPITGLKGRVTVEQLEAQLQSLTCGKLFRPSKELRASSIYAANIRRGGSAPLLHSCGAHRGQNHEELVALDRVISFENALIVGIQPTSLLERYVATTGAAIAIAIIFRKPDAPSIRCFPPRRSGLGFSRPTSAFVHFFRRLF